jgi:phage FluMu protein Com
MGTRTVFMDEKPRCAGLRNGRACNKLLAEFVARPWSIQCRHCRTVNTRNVPPSLAQTG